MSGCGSYYGLNIFYSNLSLVSWNETFSWFCESNRPSRKMALCLRRATMTLIRRSALLTSSRSSSGPTTMKLPDPSTGKIGTKSVDYSAVQNYYKKELEFMAISFRDLEICHVEFLLVFRSRYFEQKACTCVEDSFWWCLSKAITRYFMWIGYAFAIFSIW